MILKLKALNVKWEFLRQKVKRFIRECPCCQKMSVLKTSIVAHPFSASTLTPMECLNIDFIGPYPDNQYVLVIIDTFTRWVELFLTSDATGESAAKSLVEHFGRFGSPTQLRSDRGPAFIAEVIKQFLSLVGTEHCLTLAYSKEENSIVERANKEVNRHLTALTFDSSVIENDKVALPLVQRILNSAYDERTKVSPAQMLFGKALSLDRGIFLPPSERNASTITKPLSEYLSNLLKVQEEVMIIARDKLALTDSLRIGLYDWHRTDYEPNSFVLVKWRKGTAPSRQHTIWRGPLKVISHNLNEYSLFDLVKKQEVKYHVTDLKQFYFNPERHSPQDIARKDYLEFFVERVVSHRGTASRSSNLEFYIKWLGYDDSYNSWEPFKEIRLVDQLHEYLISNNMEKFIPKDCR